MIHAEIESYLETRCLDTAELGFDQWVKTRNLNSVAFCLYTMVYSGWSALGGIEGLPKVSNQNDLECRLGCAKKQYEKVVGDNNGIKKENLKEMLVPLSIRIDLDIDPDWVIAMSNFGGDRGKVAHMTWKANIPPDPGDLDTLLRKTLLPGLNSLDKKFDSVVDSNALPIKEMGFFHRVKIAFNILLKRH
ncbi:MAG: hypothetical protein EOP06_30925 [Proteobacteria bacterium]|nr:MAG: hypothetical protein EOP06_30925 [Pseudomonadota bacterium]